MTLTTDQGQNITAAVSVLKETYQNLELLFKELDRIGEEEGFIPVTPKFLRWKSDAYYDGWLTSNFIKLYEVEEDSAARTKTVYGAEIDLEGEEYPSLSIIQYIFDAAEWPESTSPSDHWIFWDPFRRDNLFNIEENNGVWTSTPLEKMKKRYRGMIKATAVDMPLVSVTSPEDVRQLVFEGFKKKASAESADE